MDSSSVIPPPQCRPRKVRIDKGLLLRVAHHNIGHEYIRMRPFLGMGCPAAHSWLGGRL